MRPENIESIYELSPTQKGLIFHCLYSPKSGVYLGQFSCTFSNLNTQAFERAWQHIVERHTIFRTAFFWKETDKPLQVVSRVVSLPLEQQDWRELTSEEQETHWRTLLSQDRVRDFDFSSPPLMRFTLVRIDENTHRFIWSHHHLLMDGWSVTLVLKELFSFYRAFIRGSELELQPPRPYRDYVNWLQQQDLAAAEEFWSRTLAGIQSPTTLLPQQINEPQVASGEHYHEAEVQLSARVSSQLRNWTRRQQLTLNTVMQGAWALLLSRYNSTEEVLFGTVVSGRPPELAGVEEMVGLFINTLPVRLKVDEAEELEEWLRRLQEQQVEMRRYEYTPLSLIQRCCQLPPDAVLFENLLAVENYPVDSALRREAQDLEVSMARSTEKANYPLAVSVIPKSEIILKINYDGNRFEQSTIERKLRHLQTIVEAMPADSRRPLSSLPLLTAEEHDQILLEWNQTQRDYARESCIHHLFEAQVERHPERVALVLGDERLTYAQLNARANQLAHYLRRLGVGPDLLVGVYIKRSTKLIVTLLAILKAGGAYLPLDHSSPPGRLALIIDNARLPLILTSGVSGERLPGGKTKIVNLDEEQERIALESNENPRVALSSDNLAYVVYTSGSTGQPKGVSVAHRSVLRLVQNNNYADLNADEVFLQVAPASFDASTFEIWGSLLNGARLIITTQDTPSLRELGRTIREHQVSIIFLTSGLFNVMVDEQLEDLKRVGQVLTGGEVFSPLHARKFMQKARGSRLVNVYGPTENTTFTSSYLVADLSSCAPPIPIGHPIANTQIYILDRYLRPVPCGVSGELYIGGDGLARDYFRSPALTAESYIPHPFSEKPGARLYKTGDLARYLPNGEIEFLGRIDYQVKIRGFRIEAGEVEAALLTHPEIKEAVVVAREDTPGEKRLVGYIVANSGDGPSTGELQSYLKDKLPEYMIPHSFATLDALPLNPNGKFDRHALPAPESVASHSDPLRRFPQTAMEQLLAEIWCKVLGLEDVGVEDNFFELGGDSILSIQIAARANRAGLQLSPKHLFLHPDIEQLARVAKVEGAVAEAEQEMVTGAVELTPVQRWFFELDLPHPEHFNQATLLLVSPDIEIEFLRKALAHLLLHHDALRLRFHPTADGWVVRYSPAEEMSFEIIDVSDAENQEELRQRIEEKAEQVQATLNISEGPLARAVYFDCGAGESGRLLLVSHHLAVDGVSWRILLDDLQRGYEQLKSGYSIDLGLKTTSYQQWAALLKKQAQSERFISQMDYWSGQAWEQARRLPVDYPASEWRNSSARSIMKELSVEETRALLQKVPEAYHTQIIEVLMTALERMLGEWIGEGAVVVDLEGHGREELREGVDLSRTVGWFTSIYPVLLRTSASEEIGSGLKKVKEQIRQIPEKGIGYGMLKYLSEEESVREQMRAIPSASISFNYLGQFDQVSADGWMKGAEESSGRSESEEGRLRYSLQVNSMVRGGKLQTHWTYSREAHEEEMIRRVAENYQRSLKEIINHCASGVGGFTPSDFPEANLSQSELDEILSELEAE